VNVGGIASDMKGFGSCYENVSKIYSPLRSCLVKLSHLVVCGRRWRSRIEPSCTCRRGSHGQQQQEETKTQKGPHLLPIPAESLKARVTTTLITVVTICALSQ